MKKIKVFLVLILTLTISGCFLKQKDLGQMLFPISLGISYENNKYKLYLQVLNTSTISIIEDESSQIDSSYIIIQVEEESISKAFETLKLEYHSTIDAIKLKSIIFHKSIFTNGNITYEQICQYFVNNPLFRTNVEVFVTDTSLTEFYSVKYMLVGSSIYSHTNEEEPQLMKGYVNPSFLLTTLKNLTDANRMYYFPIMNVTKKIVLEGDNEGSTSSINSYEYGGVCFSTYIDTNLECLTKEEAYGFRWENEIEEIPIIIEDETNPLNLIVSDVKWKLSIKNSKFKIEVTPTAYINLNLTNYSIEHIQSLLEKKIKEEIFNTLTLGYQKSIDIYYLNDYAYRKNNSLKYNLDNVEINVTSKIENTTYYKY